MTTAEEAEKENGMTNRDRLNEAFARMRRTGLVARQNFSCCGSCASAELASVLRAKPRKVGAAYYHRQEGARLRGWRTKWGSYRDGAEKVSVGYGSLEGAVERDAYVGGLVAEAAKAAGLGVEWDGDPSRCVIILLPGGVDAEVTEGA